MLQSIPLRRPAFRLPTSALATLLVLALLPAAGPLVAGNTTVDDPPTIATETIDSEPSATLLVLGIIAAVTYEGEITISPGTTFEAEFSFNALLDSPMQDSYLRLEDPAAQNGATIQVVDGGGPFDSSVTYQINLGSGPGQGLEAGDRLKLEHPDPAFLITGSTLTDSSHPLEVEVKIFAGGGQEIDLGGDHKADLVRAARAVASKVSRVGFQRIDPQDPRRFENGGLVDDSARWNLTWRNGLRSADGLLIGGLEDIGALDVTLYGNLNQVTGAEIPDLAGGRRMLQNAGDIFTSLLDFGNSSALEQSLQFTVSGLGNLTDQDLYLSVAYLPNDPNQPIRILQDDRVTRWRNYSAIFDDSFESGDTSAFAFCTCP